MKLTEMESCRSCWGLINLLKGSAIMRERQAALVYFYSPDSQPQNYIFLGTAGFHFETHKIKNENGEFWLKDHLMLTCVKHVN